MLHFLFPKAYGRNIPDEFFTDQFLAFSEAGFSVSLCPDAVLAGSRLLDAVPDGSTVVYRGWMLTAEQYLNLARAVERSQAAQFTTPTDYLATHHLPNWYPLLTDLTAETRVVPADTDIESELRSLGWEAYFLKDYVKSLKTSRGSIVRDPAEAPAVVEEMREYRGEIEGGLCIRRFEEFEADSEQRFFVLRGVSHAPTQSESVPEIVTACARRIPSPFFSVDIARRRDGRLRVVEVGDGQVSDLVGWTPQAFVRIWQDYSGIS
jgi:hypothetical protein